MFQKGENVYAIVKNSGTFQLEVIEGTINHIDNDNITVRKQESPVMASLYTYPIAVAKQNIFYDKDQADKELVVQIEAQKYHKEG